MLDEKTAFEQFLQEHGLSHTYPSLKGGDGAVQLQHVMLLKDRARQGEAALEAALAEAGVADGSDRQRLAGLLRQRLQARGGLELKPDDRHATDWNDALAAVGVPREEVEKSRPASDEPPATQVAPDGEIWPAGMKIVNPHLAQSIKAQGMLQVPNTFGYLHLAAEVERPRPLHKPSPARRELLERLKEKARLLLEAEPADVRRADVFNAFLIPPGTNPGLKLIRERSYDVHIAEFDVVVLVECASPEAALRVRETPAFRALKDELDRAARFVHCIAASNPKRIAEVDKTRDGVFLFNYFYAADVASKGAEGIDILLAVWEYTAGWWTAKANLTNSTPVQPLPGERSEYSLINHCRWDRALDVFPSLIFRPSLEQFVLANFTANDIAAMPVLYHLA